MVPALGFPFVLIIVAMVLAAAVGAVIGLLEIRSEARRQFESQIDELEEFDKAA